MANMETGGMESYVRGNLAVRIGGPRSFEPDELAEIRRKMVDCYIEEGTFGNFPSESEVETQKLMGAMSDRLDDNRALVSVWDRRLKQVVGGCLVIVGNGSRRMCDAIGKADSSLPTLAALEFEICDQEWREIEEDKIVCYSRYWRLPEKYWNGRFDRNGRGKQIAKETLSAMARAAARVALRKNKVPLIGILDTHDPRVVETLVRYYGGRVISDMAGATAAVKAPNPLHWHYEGREFFTIVGFDFEQQLIKAVEVDQSLGDKQNILWNSWRQIAQRIY